MSPLSPPRPSTTTRTEQHPAFGWPSGQLEDIGLGGYLAWWDHWLQDEPAAPLPAKGVTSYEISSTGVSAGWQQLAQWPAHGAREPTLRLTDDGSSRCIGGVLNLSCSWDSGA